MACEDCGSEDKYHGGSPRVRREENEDLEGEGPVIEIDPSVLASKTLDAALTAGVSLIVAQAIKDK